jgi:ankyrin repeat protein
VHHGDLDLVGRLIRAGAKVNARNEYGATPMSEAAVVADPAMLEALLAAGADVESPNADGQTVLMVVARTSQVDAARVLLKRGANVNAVEQWRGQTALMWAAAQQQPAMVKALLAAGANVNARSTVNNWERQVTAEPRAIYRPAGGLTPLLYAAREGCVECATMLIEAGANINLADPEGISPLLLAVMNMHFDLAAALIRKGANPDKWDFWGRAPLYTAIDLNTIPRGGRPDRPSLDKTTSLDVAGMLLEAGANVNVQLKLSPPFRNIGNDRGLDGLLTMGATPLLRAAKALDAPAIRVLLEHGADVKLASSRGITPLMAAAGMGSVDADARLLSVRGR